MLYNWGVHTPARPPAIRKMDAVSIRFSVVSI